MTENVNENVLDIVTLKQQIEENKFYKDLLICICKDDTAKFLADQYFHFYAHKNGSEIERVENPNLVVGDIFGDGDISMAKVFVYFSENLKEVPTCPNAKLWIICDKCSKKIRDKYPYNVIEFPKLEDWQIKDYVVTTAGITEEQADTLISTYRDIKKLDIEIQKLTIFRQNMYLELEDQLVVIEELPIFELTNALIQRDKEKLAKSIEEGVDHIEPFQLIPLLVKNLSAVISIQLGKNPTAESVGMSGKQFWAVQKYSCGHYNREELLYLYDFVTNIDAQIKDGKLDTTHVVNYIVSKFLGFM